MSEDSPSEKPKKKADSEKGRDEKTEKPSRDKNDPWWVGLIDIASTISEKFGIAAIFLLLMLCSVWFLGSKETHDDFIRAFLFGGFKHKDESPVDTNGVRFVVGVLTLGAVVEWVGGRWLKQKEKDEMTRLSKENLKLQKKIESLQTSDKKPASTTSTSTTAEPILPPANTQEPTSARDKARSLEQASASQGKEPSP